MVAAAIALSLIGVGAAFTQTSFSVNMYGGRLPCGSAWSATFNQTRTSYAIKFYGGQPTPPPPRTDGQNLIVSLRARPFADACLSRGEKRAAIGLSLAGLGALTLITLAALRVQKHQPSH